MGLFPAWRRWARVSGELGCRQGLTGSPPREKLTCCGAGVGPDTPGPPRAGVGLHRSRAGLVQTLPKSVGCWPALQGLGWHCCRCEPDDPGVTEVRVVSPAQHLGFAPRAGRAHGAHASRQKGIVLRRRSGTCGAIGEQNRALPCLCTGSRAGQSPLLRQKPIAAGAWEVTAALTASDLRAQHPLPIVSDGPSSCPRPRELRVEGARCRVPQPPAQPARLQITSIS